MPPDERRPLRAALDPISTPYFSQLASTASGTMSMAKEVLLSGLGGTDYRKSESMRILSDLTPSLMSPRIVNHASAAAARGISRSGHVPPSQLLRLPTYLPSTFTQMTVSSGRQNLSSLAILETADTLQELSLTPPPLEMEQPSLIKGFKATIPSSEIPKQRRRLLRGGLGEEEPGGKLGLKKLGDRARGLLTEGDDEDPRDQGLEMGRKSTRRKARERRRIQDAHGGRGKLHLEDLVKQADEIAQDKDNLYTRTSLIHAEINAVSAKIDALEEIRRRLESSLLHLQEEQLELDDELEGVQELMTSPTVTSAAGTKTLPASAASLNTKSSRRRKGPAFLPSEHDELPSGVAFMTLERHSAPITALDFDEPYGMLVTAGQDEVVKVWDLCDGEELGILRGHSGTVKAVQVEETLCLTGSSDGTVRLWDLRVVEDYEERLARRSERMNERGVLEKIAEHDKRNGFFGDDEHDGRHDDDEQWEEGPSGITQGTSASLMEEHGPCVRVLEGHSKGVTSLYYEDGVLVTGSSDKTIRKWDITTGQCLLTMDILWAISNPPHPAPPSPRKPKLRHRSSTSFGSVQYDDILPSPGLSTTGDIYGIGMNSQQLLQAATSQNFAVPSPPYSDGTWDMYTDFVGGLQFWGYALASGSGDGGVRMWDLRTGQAHRTLNGHTAPVTCLQFDENNIVTGSLDRSIRIWDIRMGDVSEVHKYEYPVTALQFDSRKVVACTGENGIEVYNRTTHQHSRMIVNGHTKPAERLRFMDKYMVSGGRDGCAKIWAM